MGIELSMIVNKAIKLLQGKEWENYHLNMIFFPIMKNLVKRARKGGLRKYEYTFRIPGNED